MAALLTRMSSRPNVWSACSTARAASPASGTSAAKPETRPARHPVGKPPHFARPACRTAFMVPAGASALASTSTAIPPSAQMSSPVAAPMPAPPPVIRAALPSTRFMPVQSLGRHDAELLGGGSGARALQLDRGLEFGRAAEIGELSGVVEPRRNRRIGADLPD